MRIPILARFALFASASHVIIAVQLAFWPLFLAARGLDATEMGIVTGIGLWARVAAHPMVGFLADLSGDRRRVMLILSVFALLTLGGCSAHNVIGQVPDGGTGAAGTGGMVKPMGKTLRPFTSRTLSASIETLDPPIS